MTPRSLLEPARLAGTPLLRGQSDARLVDLTRAGNTRAFEAIVQRYRRPLMRYCQRLLGREQAEDTVQQTFIRAYEAIQRGDNQLNLRPWLYRIAHNASIDALRRGGRAHEELDPQIDGVERPDQAVERREAFTAVIAAVDKLPERQRNAVLLRELEGRSYEEIAATLGVTGGAVRQLLNRARTTLRAGVTAVTPLPVLARLGAGAETESVAARIAEICAPAGASAVAAKLTAAVVVTSAVAGGVATSPLPDVVERERGPDRAEASTGKDGSPSASEGAGAGASDGAGDDLDDDGRGEEGDRREGDGDGRKGDGREDDREDREDANDDRSGHGDGDGDEDPGDEDHSGPGHGGARDEDNSGPGSGDDPDHDNSGPGSGHDESGGGDSSGPGGGGESGSGHSGPGGGEDLAVDEDNSGSGSSGSGSGSSGSGSGSSGSGSGNSGSGSSGSG